MAVARYRERHTVSRGKSDHADAMTLANILRTDQHVHRRLPADTHLAQTVAVLARAHQDATWRRTRASNELRSLLLCEYYPAFLEAFAGKTASNLATVEARAMLAIAPTPDTVGKLSKARIAAALRRAGRQRRIDTTAAQLHAALREPQLRQPELVEQAMGRQALALLATLDTECRNVAELGDDRTRFTDARSVKAYAGSAPITRASGRSVSITHRRVKNDRLAAAGWAWAFAALAHDDHANRHYRHRRDHGDRHAAALLHLFNRMLGQLYFCLQTGQHYQPHKAFTNHNTGTELDRQTC